MLRTDPPNTLPFNNAYGAIVTAMDTSNVDTVLIAGKAMKRGGKLVGVDLASVGRQAAASRDDRRALAALGHRHEPVGALRLLRQLHRRVQ
jgi:cytosine/adenosine deaminase-related metal-dependent hydrolase